MVATTPEQILVVEDDPGIRDVLCSSLKDEGFAVTPAADGMAAVDWLNTHRPALVLLDMQLPRVGGTAVAHHLQTQYGTHVPIIVVTADDTAARRAGGVGAAASFLKPFDLDRLMTTVHRLTETSTMEDSAQG